MKIIKINCLARLAYLAKYNKYIADLEISNNPKIKGLFLSIKQAENLKKSFNGNAYSTKNNQVYSVIDFSGEKPRFIWSCSNYHNAVKMAERFGAVIDG